MGIICYPELTLIVVNPKDQPILSDVVANRNLEDVKGFLYYVVRVIENYITKKGTKLSNELLDQLKEADYIDNSIIQLLAEDVSVENLETEINTLIENTLTFHQSDERLRTRLRELFNLRADRIRPVVENGTIDLIKYTGIPLRSFNIIEKLIDYNTGFLSEVENPLDSRWLDFLFDILYKIEDFQTILPLEINKESFIQALVVWMKGGWYHDIAESLKMTVDNALVFIRFIEYGLQNSATSIIKYIEVKRGSLDQDTSTTIINWPNYALYGIDEKVKLDLVEINIPDRILVHNISNWIKENEFEYDNLGTLRSIITTNQLLLTKYLESNTPQISMISLQQYIEWN